jgi:hypothetical protein
MLTHRNGVQWSDSSVEVCKQTKCPLDSGSDIHIVVVDTVAKLMPGHYQAGVTTNGYTSDFKGLRVLACTGTLSFDV